MFFLIEITNYFINNNYISQMDSSYPLILNILIYILILVFLMFLFLNLFIIIFTTFPFLKKIKKNNKYLDIKILKL